MRLGGCKEEEERGEGGDPAVISSAAATALRLAHIAEPPFSFEEQPLPRRVGYSDIQWGGVA